MNGIGITPNYINSKMTSTSRVESQNSNRSNVVAKFNPNLGNKLFKHQTIDANKEKTLNRHDFNQINFETAKRP